MSIYFSELKESLCTIIQATVTVFCFFLHSTIIPERLDPFINRYAEYTHDKWAFEKVQHFTEGNHAHFSLILLLKDQTVRFMYWKTQDQSHLDTDLFYVR